METKEYRVLVIEDNPMDASLVKGLLTKPGEHTFHVRVAETLLTALNDLTSRHFDVILTDLNLPDSEGLDTLATLRRHAGGVPIVVRSGNEDEAVAISAVQKGAQDFIMKKEMSAEGLARVLRYAVMRNRTSAETAKSEPIRAIMAGVLGAKGGVGTTTMACLFAAELCKQSTKPVLMMDLDTGASLSSFLMQRESQYSTLDVCKNLHRLDEDLWRGLVPSVGLDSVDILQSSGADAAPDQFTSERVRHVLRFSRSLYGWVVVDLGQLDPLAQGLLSEIQELFLVTTDDLPSLYLTGRKLMRLTELGIRSEQVHLVVNRGARGNGPAAADLEKALGCQVYAELPDCSDDLAEAYANRRFLDESLSLRRPIGKLTSKLLGIEAKTPARASRKLFGFSRLKTAPVGDV